MRGREQRGHRLQQLGQPLRQGSSGTAEVQQGAGLRLRSDAWRLLEHSLRGRWVTYALRPVEEGSGHRPDGEPDHEERVDAGEHPGVCELHVSGAVDARPGHQGRRRQGSSPAPPARLREDQ